MTPPEAAPTAGDALVVEQLGPVRVLRLNRPEAHNTMTGAVLAELSRQVVDADDDPDTRVLVITATGERTFCAGLDLAEFSAEGIAAVDTSGFVAMLHGELATPVVTAANGTAVGGGFELLLAGDVIVASSTASFGFPEVRRGLIPGGNGTMLGARIPLVAAMELLLTGERISADRALAVGLVNEVVAPPDVLGRAMAIAERIAANGPLAVRAAKELVRTSAVDPSAARRRLAELQPVVFASEDATEGATAYVEKRDPVWKGR